MLILRFSERKPRLNLISLIIANMSLLSLLDIVSAGTLRDELADAIRCEDIDSLERAIADAEAAGYPELGSDLLKARDALEILGGGRGG